MPIHTAKAHTGRGQAPHCKAHRMWEFGGHGMGDFEGSRECVCFRPRFLGPSVVVVLRAFRTWLVVRGFGTWSVLCAFRTWFVCGAFRSMCVSVSCVSHSSSESIATCLPITFCRYRSLLHHLSNPVLRKEACALCALYIKLEVPFARRASAVACYADAKRLINESAEAASTLDIDDFFGPRPVDIYGAEVVVPTPTERNVTARCRALARQRLFLGCVADCVCMRDPSTGV